MKINKKLIIIIISIISLLGILTTAIIINKNKYVKNKYVNIDNLVYEAYISKNGYDSNMKKHMDIKVFNSSNIREIHLSTIYIKVFGKVPDTIDFKLTEINQHKINNKIFVYMKYSYEVPDPSGKIESGVWNVPVVFQVVEKDGEPYIEKKTEYDADCDVPKAYR